MVVLGIDRSHWNTMPNFAAMKAGGLGFVFCKGTDGSGYLDPTFAPTRAGAEAAGLIFGPYHFAEWGNVATEANFFLTSCAPRPGELIGLDLEAAVPAGVDPVAWAVAWSRIVHDHTGAYPLAYMNQSWVLGHDWAPLVTLGDGLWLAKYDGAPSGGPLGAWPVLAMKQFTDSATGVPGQPGAIDEDAFQGDLAALRLYTVPGSPPAPTTPPEDSMWLIRNPDTTIVYLVGEFSITPIPDPPTLQPYLDAGVKMVDKPQADIDRVTAQVLAAQKSMTEAVWSFPFPQPIDGSKDTTWPLDRLRGIDKKTGQSQPVAIDQAGADLVAASLVANPDFKSLITQAAQAVVAAMDADLTKRFGNTPA